MQNQPGVDRSRANEDNVTRTIAVTFIISCTLIVLACIASLAIVLGVFFANPPW